MDIDEAAANFKRATRHCDNIIQIHRGHGGGAQGKRTLEPSLNRAAIVLTVASWQALIQDLTLACLDQGAPIPGAPISPNTYAVIAGRARKEVEDFATPNARNSGRLLRGVGFDPKQHWTWTQPGGHGQGRIRRTPSDAERMIDEWLKVRHAIAHGHSKLPVVNVLAAVRQSTPPPTDPQVRLVDSEQCLAFFRRLAKLTGDALALHLGVTSPAWA